MGKMKRWQKTVCAAAAVCLMAAFGFMGIEKFMPEERSLRIVEDNAVTTGAKAKTEAPETREDLNIKAKSAMLIDGHSGKVIYAQNEKKHLPPASVTKVMTLLLVMEACESGKISLDDKVTVSERAASMGGSQMYMEPGEQHTVEELIKGVIMVSANDGCVALAEHLSGSVEGFVKAMNRRASELGLSDSNFVNTNGLPVADHYSCAYDIGMISAELMKHDEAHKWFTKWQEDIKVGLPGKESKFTLTNTNKLIRTYSGAIGVKTGFTQDAGYCLSGAADRDGTQLIAVVLGCESSDIRFKETARLLDHGFANYETVIMAKAGVKQKRVNIEKGEEQKIYAVSPEDIGVTVRKGSGGKIKKKIRIDDDIKMPVKKNEKIGEMVLYKDEERIGKFPLVSDRDTQEAGYMTIYIRMMKNII